MTKSGFSTDQLPKVGNSLPTLIFNQNFDTRVRVFWTVLKSRLDQIIIQTSSGKMISSISVQLELDMAGLSKDILVDKIKEG